LQRTRAHQRNLRKLKSITKLFRCIAERGCSSYSVMAPRTPRRCIGLSNRPSTVGDNLVRVPQPPPPRTPAQQLHRPNGSPTGSPNGRRPTTALQESLEDSRPSRRFKQPPALAHLRQMTLDAPCMPDELPAELKEGKSARGLGPHAEFALATLRDFFKKRPAQALLDAFRQQDVDRNGLIDETEFCRTLRQLNLDMPQRDMSAMFQAVDSDASGMIEFHEFYKNLRTDKFKRSDFFWGKQRPWEVLDRPQRNSLAGTRRTLRQPPDPLPTSRSTLPLDTHPCAPPRAASVMEQRNSARRTAARARPTRSSRSSRARSCERGCGRCTRCMTKTARARSRPTSSSTR